MILLEKYSSTTKKDHCQFLSILFNSQFRLIWPLFFTKLVSCLIFADESMMVIGKKDQSDLSMDDTTVKRGSLTTSAGQVTVY